MSGLSVGTKTSFVLLLVPVFCFSSFTRMLNAAPRTSARRTAPAGGKTEKKEMRLIEKYLKNARRFRSKGQNQQALAEYWKAVEVRSDMCEIYFELAELYFEVGIYPKVVEILEPMIENALKYGGQDSRAVSKAFGCLAQAYDKMGESERASGIMVKAASLYPEDPGLHAVIATMHTARGRPKDAIRAYTEALKYDPENVDILHALGDLALSAKSQETARDVCVRLYTIDRSYGAAFAEKMRQAGIDPGCMPDDAEEPVPDDPYAMPD